MSYQIEIYQNTGLNSANIARSKSDIATFATSTTSCSDVYIRQQKWLTEVRVRATWSQVENADYLIIYTSTVSDGFCYFVTGVSMVADDVAELTLVPDFVTTIGVDNLTIIDGITVRSTYALDMVDPWELDQGDSYLAPSGSMDLLSDWHDEGTAGGLTLIESSIDIVRTATSTNAVTCTDTGTSETVTYPVPTYVSTDMYPQYGLQDSSSTTLLSFRATGSALVQPDTTATSVLTGVDYKTYIQRGLSRIRGLGLESAILSQYYIPKKYLSPASQSPAYGSDTASDTEPYYFISSLFGVDTEEATTISLIQESATTREGNVLNFSDYCRFGILSVSGDSIEADPKDLKLTTGYPSIRIISDPRPDGRPYFRFKYINNTSTDRAEFFRNCVPGLQWKQLPLVFTQASGSALNTVNFLSSRRSAETARNNDTINQNASLALANMNYANQKEINRKNNLTKTVDLGLNVPFSNIPINAMRAAGSVIDSKLGRTGGDYASGGTPLDSLVENATQGVMSLLNINNEIAAENQQQSLDLAMQQAQYSADTAYQTATYTYATQKLNDMLSYGIAQNCQLPTVMFPYQTETLRDFCGNGFLVYRYFYNSNDIARVKKILRAYGAKYSMCTESAHFTDTGNRNYCYIETSGLTLGGLPQWLADGAALQLNGGVRIWDVRPQHIS